MENVVTVEPNVVAKGRKADRFDDATLGCSHCGANFRASRSQALKAHYQQSRVFCSSACRVAKQQERGLDSRFLRGPCIGCGAMFHSNTKKKFCTMDCYSSSPQFKAHGEAIRAKSRTPESVAKRAAAITKHQPQPCGFCGVEFKTKSAHAGGRSKYCSMACYRGYMNGRFDRWVASPQGLALPQCYDEFLDSEELPCLIEGCGWVGRHLTSHVNLAHGIQAAEFKRAAGFNLSSGIIGRELASTLSNSARSRSKYPDMLAVRDARRSEDQPNAVSRYHSLEGREHSLKARALICEEVGPERKCLECNESFTQSTPMGRAMYCSRSCRKEYYRKQRVRS